MCGVLQRKNQETMLGLGFVYPPPLPNSATSNIIVAMSTTSLCVDCIFYDTHPHRYTFSVIHRADVTLKRAEVVQFSSASHKTEFTKFTQTRKDKCVCVNQVDQLCTNCSVCDFMVLFM